MEPEPEARPHDELVNMVSSATTQTELKQIWSTLSKSERESVKAIVAQLGEQLKGKE
jgi:GTP-sensing pleiotropic transcriptional regulator CodY